MRIRAHYLAGWFSNSDQVLENMKGKICRKVLLAVDKLDVNGNKTTLRNLDGDFSFRTKSWQNHQLTF